MAYTAIDDPEAYYQTQLYTGNGSANHAITLGGDTDMQPDLVWIKNRDASDVYCIFDAVRGATNSLDCSTSAIEVDDDDTLDSFTSDGFQVDADVKVNTSSENYVSWNWKESATSGFDIVGYTGTGSAHTISHSLSAKPGMFILKSRSRVANGQVWHNKLSADSKILYLSTTHSEQEHGAIHNSTQPTSSVFTVGDASESNDDGETYIAYLWAEKQGFSKFGRYVGNGADDGTFIYTGFRPAFVMIKRYDSSGSWRVIDSKRNSFNGEASVLYWDLGTEPEGTAGFGLTDIVSNGFKLRDDESPSNTDGGTMIYMAFAEAPFVNSKGVPCNAR